MSDIGHYVTGNVIRVLREKQGRTQRQLAQELAVSDKAVSKWETGRGLPDVTLIEPLAKALRVSVAELLSGELTENRNRSGNPLRAKFYVCPLCGNVIWSMGEGAFSCCGIALPPLEAEKPDEAHAIRVEAVEDEWYLSADHPMTKEHYLTFAALVNSERVQICKLYPQQLAQLRFPRRGGGTLYLCCNRHGLYRFSLPGKEAPGARAARRSFTEQP